MVISLSGTPPSTCTSVGENDAPVDDAEEEKQGSIGDPGGHQGVAAAAVPAEGLVLWGLVQLLAPRGLVEPP